MNSPPHIQSSSHDGPSTLEVIVEPPRVVQPGDTFPCPVVLRFQPLNRSSVEDARRESEALEDGRIFPAAYLVSGNTAATPNIDGPPMANAHSSAFTGSLKDMPHAPSANGVQEAGIWFVVFQNLAINDVGSYRLQICIFEMTSDESPGTQGSARHVQSVLTREITVTEASPGNSIGM
ncbi:MAG: hypothetical protein HETSPECPRED_009749 [Heterodermia speciosa]|uniref:Velvet domain-containing protein n=1 Tax=Heterodermia speciosa TaxID=116794 RepID=A0A8H3IWB9_9LECA|nr:MAG: hypothetical protein HETSPECPRED_009749 [Heterodermia speciosa]